MILQSKVKGTIGHVMKSVLLGRNSIRDSDRYRVNLIHISKNDNSNNNVHDPSDLGDGSLSHIF